jgi:predicted Zn finger-like uncharacterized protein
VKFLCDRCKTRYSIGDDRVRGKILKIRCKNCANVITVREGMMLDVDGGPDDIAGRARKAATAATAATEALDARDASPGAPGDRAAGARDAVANRAANEPAAPAATAASRGGAVRDPLAGLTSKRSTEVDTVRGLGRSTARASATPPRAEVNAVHAAAAPVVAQPAPAALEEEWYVSIDGEQAGPFSLAEAQRWVTQQPPDGELHCWSEGFDDWLPVDKVSHFRGLRKRPVAPSTPPPLPRAAAGAPRPAPVEDEPKPLFAATMASLERGAPAMPAGLGLPPAAPAARATPPRGTPIAARADQGGRPTNGAQGPATAPLGPRAEVKPEARPAARRDPAAEGKPAGKTGAKDDPFDLSEGADGETVLEAMPFDDAPVEPRRSPAAPGKPAAALDGASPGAPTPSAAPPPTDFGSDDELHIGEVSRVVNLADIARGSRAQDRLTPRPVPTAPSGATRSTGLPPSPRPGSRSTASTASVSPAEGEPGVSMAPVARAQRRGLIALLAIVGVLVLGVVGAVVFVITRSDDAPSTSLGTVQDIDTSRPDDPVAHHPVGSAGSVGSTGSASPAVPAPPAPVVPRPHPRPPSPGTGQIAESPPAGNALGGDEIEDVARKHQEMTQRCYMRAQRGAEAILIGDVKKIAVTLTIDREGNVSDLQLSDHGADLLGKCLTGAIRTWKFRPSSGGTFRLSLNFVNG